MPEETPDPYEPLYEQYKEELRALYERLVSEAQAVIERRMEQEELTEEAARDSFFQEHGPLVHDGRAVHLIRKYWLELARLERERSAQGEETLAPLTFLVEDLADDEEDELVSFLTEIAYWPIGLDENNEWC